MIDLDERHLDTVRAILREHVPDCEVRIFGSRVTGHAQPFSDLDLAVIGREKLDWRRLEALKDAFSESDLPISVDVLDWNAISGSFRQLIEDNCETLDLRAADGRMPEGRQGRASSLPG